MAKRPSRRMLRRMGRLPSLAERGLKLGRKQTVSVYAGEHRPEGLKAAFRGMAGSIVRGEKKGLLNFYKTGKSKWTSESLIRFGHGGGPMGRHRMRKRAFSRQIASRSEGMKKAWATRRKKYGKSGSKGRKAGIPNR